ncbi:uncharacterized protein UBRO2_05907 [Ustilago bromivora]|uniref:Rab-GAP TBC domain-containing protein n=1 Tax=Ustilago bromivora TaxID=307758 RepID=A0A8H8QSC7_9BASI|nr:uncharacterized protein UBRO2_05907 [Ustilago bromivora]
MQYSKTDETSDVAQTLTRTSKLCRSHSDPGGGLIITGPSFINATAGHRGLSTSSAASHPTSVDMSFSNDAHSTEDGDEADGGSKGPNATGKPSRKRSVRSSRQRQQLLNCLSKQSVDIAQLRTLAWAGAEDELRLMVWQLLLGYLSASAPILPCSYRDRCFPAAALSHRYSSAVFSL